MEQQFEIRKEKDDNYRFEIKNEAGQFLFSSISFSNKKEVKTTIEHLQTAKSGSLIFERKTNYDGKFHFNLKTSNSSILGNSSPYESQAGMENGIKLLKNHLSAKSY